MFSWPFLYTVLLCLSLLIILVMISPVQIVFLTNCLSPDIEVRAVIILQQPPYLMLPVHLSEPWYDDVGLLTLKQATDLLQRPRRFISALIWGISALIALATSLTVSAVALTKQIHTASYVDDLSKNTTLALTTQEIIDEKLEAKVNTLEEAILQIGQELTNWKVRLALRCHVSYRWICVTPLKVNQSLHSWEKIKNHIQGIWNHSDFSLDICDLHRQINNINQAEESFSASEVATNFFTSLTSFVGEKNWSSFIVNIAVTIGALMICLCLFPVFLKLIFNSISRVSAELHLLALKSKKGGDAGSRGYII